MIATLEKFHPQKEAVALISEELARKFGVMPLFIDAGSLYLAVANPDDISSQDYLQTLTGLTIEPLATTRGELDAALNRLFLTHEHSARAMQAAEPTSLAAEAAPSVVVEDSRAPAIQLVNYILGQAINLGASDIHLEPFPSRVMLRYRVDGVLHEFPAPPLHLARALVSRFKILSSLDVAERRLPQDGRASFTHNNVPYDLRVSIIPNLHGESVVVRILDTHGGGKLLSDLGFEDAMRLRYEGLIQKPHGILLVTGPTGAGKSTTLYATLRQILTPKKKIITLEDPVEYFLEGVTQIPVHPAIGFTFATALRSVLRHDPDVVMLGEIRDPESAEIAVRASMTGHLVFSTLHTNDAPSAVARLLDMGIPGYLVMSSLTGVVAQRLLRRLCPKCKSLRALTSEEQAALGVDEPLEVYHPVGCVACNNLGYRGRVAVYELLEITPAVRALYARETPPTSAVRAAADFTTLRQDATAKLRAGIVSVEDVVALTMDEEE